MKQASPGKSKISHFSFAISHLPLSTRDRVVCGLSTQLSYTQLMNSVRLKLEVLRFEMRNEKWKMTNGKS